MACAAGLGLAGRGRAVDHAEDALRAGLAFLDLSDLGSLVAAYFTDDDKMVARTIFKDVDSLKGSASLRACPAVAC